MNIKSLSQVMAGIFVMVASVAGCHIKADVPEDAQASLEVHWTIDESEADWLCDAYGADEVEIAVFTSEGYPETTDWARCESFSTWVNLPKGEYTAEITMLDEEGYAVSDTLVVEDVRLHAWEDREIVVDFALDIFR